MQLTGSANGSVRWGEPCLISPTTLDARLEIKHRKQGERPCATNEPIMTANLTLKWGTVKGWDGFEEGTKPRALMEKYLESGVPFSAAMRRDTPEQKQIICEIIEALDGEIYNDWEGTVMTKDEAKQYVTTYGQVSEPADH